MHFQNDFCADEVNVKTLCYKIGYVRSEIDHHESWLAGKRDVVVALWRPIPSYLKTGMLG